MPKVKIIYSSSGWDYSDSSIIRDMTDWEEVSDDDLSLLTKNQHMLKPFCDDSGNYFYPKLFVHSVVSVTESIKSVKDQIDSIKVWEAAEKKKKEAAAERRRMAKIKDKKALLDKLKKELGEE